MKNDNTLEELIENEDIVLAKIKKQITDLKKERADILKRRFDHKEQIKEALKQEIFYMRTKENMTYRQIGKILSKSHEAVRNIFLSSPTGNFYCRKGIVS